MEFVSYELTGKLWDWVSLGIQNMDVENGVIGLDTI